MIILKIVLWITAIAAVVGVGAFFADIIQHQKTLGKRKIVEIARNYRENPQSGENACIFLRMGYNMTK